MDESYQAEIDIMRHLNTVQPPPDHDPMPNPGTKKWNEWAERTGFWDEECLF